MDEPWVEHPNWGPAENDCFSRCDAETGAYLDRLEPGHRLSVVVRDAVFEIERRPDGFWIRGHREFCPAWTPAKIPGSVFAKEGSMIKLNYVGVGMFLEFYPQSFAGKRVVSAEVLDVVEISA